MKLLYINPHPDDTEFTSASTCYQAVQQGWEVYEILMTSDEYGTFQDDFKGERIRRIRKNEMYQAAKVYGMDQQGKPLINLIWFGEIDGHLRFNNEVYTRLKEMVEEINPDIVIAPDSFFTMDFHPDHMYTGYLAYIIVKNIRKERINDYNERNRPIKPELLLYHSFNTNFYIKIHNISIQVEAWAKHRSQTKPLFNKLLRPLRFIFYNLKRTQTGRSIGEGFRRVSFEKEENQIVKWYHKFFYYFFGKGMKDVQPGEPRFLPTPEELGLI